MAAVGPRMVEAAATVADGMVCHPLISQSHLADVIAGRLLRERFSGLVERVTVSVPHHLDGSLALDMLAASTG